MEGVVESGQQWTGSAPRECVDCLHFGVVTTLADGRSVRCPGHQQQHRRWQKARSTYRNRLKDTVGVRDDYPPYEPFPLRRDGWSATVIKGVDGAFHDLGALHTMLGDIKLEATEDGADSIADDLAVCLDQVAQLRRALRQIANVLDPARARTVAGSVR